MNQDYRWTRADWLDGIITAVIAGAIGAGLVLGACYLTGCGPSAEEVIARGYSQCITYAQGDKVEEMRCDIQREGALNREQQYYTALMLMTP